MSLDGGGAPAGGGDSSGAQSQGSQPAPSRTPDQASAALDARVAEKRARAESVLAPPKGVDETAQRSATGGPQRGPDGKFLPRGPQHPSSISDETKPEAAAAPPPSDDVERDVSSEAPPKPEKDGETEKLKADHAKAQRDLDGYKQAVSEWEGISERALARIETQTARIAQLEAALQELGGSVDPRDVELATLREQALHRSYAEQRAQAEREAQAQAQRDAQRETARAQLAGDTKAAMAAHPEVFSNQARVVEVAKLILQSRLDPQTAVETVVARATRTSKPAPQAPRTLSNRGAGGAAPRLTDPRDIADKWKARLVAG